MAEQSDTYALAWTDPTSRQWFYIPTVPAARKWRGPYKSRDWMDNAIQEMADAIEKASDRSYPASRIETSNE